MGTPYGAWLEHFRGHTAASWCSLDASQLRDQLHKKKLSASPWFLGAPRASTKFSEKGYSKKTLGSTELAEMASRAHVARIRFEKLKTSDLTIRSASFPASGAGMDWITFLEVFGEQLKWSIGGDLSFVHSWCTAINLEESSLKTHVLSYDALKPPFSVTTDYIYCDPARRQSGERHERYIYSPELETSLEQLEQYPCAQIKLAPGETPERLITYQQRGWRWSWIQLGSDLLECFGTWIRGSELSDQPNEAIWMDRHGEVLGSFAGTSATMGGTFGRDLQVGDVVVWPPKVLYHAGLNSSWAQAHQLEPSAVAPLYFVESSSEPFHAEKQAMRFDAYTVLSEHHSSPKTLKKALRNYPDAPLEIKKLSGASLPSAFQKMLAPFLKQKGDPKTKITLAFNCDRHRVQCFLLRKV
jgi:hypothetical protein